MINETKTMLHEHDKLKYTNRSPSETINIIKKSHASIDDVKRSADKVMKQYKNAIKELAKR